MNKPRFNDISPEDAALTYKQKELISLFKRNKLKRINILEGSVSSGKTWISILLWALWVFKSPEDSVHLMVAKTLTSLRRNVLDLLQSMISERFFTYSASKKEGRLFGRLVYFEGVNDSRAESKIRGLTLRGAYCDEITLFDEDFFTMLLSRLRAKGAKLFGTTNPDNPNHWFKTKYLDRAEKGEIELLSMKFLLEDNTFLEQEYVENVKKEYTGVFYERYIQGLWTVAEGVIYSMFDDTMNTFDDSNAALEWIKRQAPRYIAVDYGTVNPMVFLDIYDDGDTIWILNEYYYISGETRVQKTDAQYADDFTKFTGNGDTPTYVIIDPSAASFRLELRSRGYRVAEANNDVLEGIRKTSTLFQKRKIRVHKHNCPNFIREVKTYAWDDKAAASGTEKPIKQSDHAMDALRYFVNTVLSKRRVTS